MCSGCGYPTLAGHWADAADTTAPERIARRQARARLLAAALAPWRIGVTASMVSPELVLARPDGARAICRTLDEVWLALERWRVPYDPLAAA
ncbi:hypothetical protein [Frigidibacter sp. MR17.24]|uniref:hypothetical protein n=1 Tax=Frigidibacter sp. MR17.24 TaxID=3127345 RepID=UPI003012CA84